MTGHREKFIQFVRRVGKMVPLNLLIKLSGQKIIAPLYHSVSDNEIIHIKNLYPVKNVKNFIADLDFLLKRYKPVDYITFQNMIVEQRHVPENIFLLTFDDGLGEFHDIIAPILLRKGIPAVCFLNSSFIDNRQLFYRYKASIILEALNNQKNISENAALQVWMQQNKCKSLQDLRSFILAVNYLNKDLLDILAGILQIDFNDYLQKQQPYLTSGQITSLQKNGFHFGSHSCDHPEYYNLDLSQQIIQTKESMEIITERFSLPYTCFAFPFTDYGVSNTFFKEIYSRQIATLTFACAGMKKEMFPQHIQRIPFEVNNLSAEEIIHAEYLYFIFKSLAGRTTVKRND